MKMIITLLLAMALLLSACGSDTITNTNDTMPTQGEEFSFIPEEDVEALLDSMTPHQLIMVGELFALCEHYEQESERYHNACSSLLKEADDRLEQFNCAEQTLLTGIPLLLEVEFDQDTNSDSTAPTAVVIMGVDEGNTPYPYPNYWVELDVNTLAFTVNPGDRLNVNGETFTADEYGIAKVPVANGHVPETLEIRWICGDLCLVALVETTDSEIQSETEPEDNTSESKHIGEEERQTIKNTLKTELTPEQYRVVEEIDMLIDYYQNLSQTYEEYTDASQRILSFLEEDLAVAENAILNGIPFCLDVIFVNEDYSSTTLESCFLMAAPEGTEQPYIYPNPWEDRERAVEMVFAGTPGATLTFNGNSFVADEQGIVEIDLEDGKVPEIIDIRWEYGENLSFTTSLNNTNKDRSILEALDGFIEEPMKA